MIKVKSKQQQKKKPCAIKQMGVEPSRRTRNKKSGNVSKDATNYKGINPLGVRGYKVNEMTDLL